MLETVDSSYFTISGSPKMVLGDNGVFSISPVSELSYDHKPASLECGGILIEPTRINFWPDNTNYTNDVTKVNTLVGVDVLGLPSVGLNGNVSELIATLSNNFIDKSCVVSCFVRCSQPIVGGEYDDPDKDICFILNGVVANIPEKYEVVYYGNNIYRISYKFSFPSEFIGNLCIISTGSTNRGNFVEVAGVQIENHSVSSPIMTSTGIVTRERDRIEFLLPNNTNDDQFSVVLKYEAFNNDGCVCQLDYPDENKKIYIAPMRKGKYPLVKEQYSPTEVVDSFSTLQKHELIRVSFSAEQIRISTDRDFVKLVNNRQHFSSPNKIVFGLTEHGQFHGYIKTFDFHIRALMESELMHGIPFYDSDLIGGNDVF